MFEASRGLIDGKYALRCSDVAHLGTVVVLHTCTTCNSGNDVTFTARTQLQPTIVHERPPPAQGGSDPPQPPRSTPQWQSL